MGEIIGRIKGIIEKNLLGKRQFFVSTASGIIKAQPAAVIGAPLAEGTVRAGVFF
jgi:hypothetical protein